MNDRDPSRIVDTIDKYATNFYVSRLGRDRIITSFRSTYQSIIFGLTWQFSNQLIVLDGPNLVPLCRQEGNHKANNKIVYLRHFFLAQQQYFCRDCQGRMADCMFHNCKRYNPSDYVQKIFEISWEEKSFTKMEFLPVEGYILNEIRFLWPPILR